MELPNLGQQCDFKNCKQLDFLPLKCKCGLIFCSEHFNSHSLICPAVQPQNEPIFDTAKADYVCSHPNCTSRSYLPLLCPKCNQHFCVVHRHVTECAPKSSEVKAAELEKFNAASKEFESIKLEVNKQLDDNIAQARKKPKTQQMANKLQLMRIKGKATGPKSVAASDRVYFNVDHPVTNGRKVSPVFFSKVWTLGRVIDAVADECKLTNKNNQSDSLKLRLFHKVTGEILSTNLAHKIESLLSDQSLTEGEDLLMEYVDNDCIHLSSN